MRQGASGKELEIIKELLKKHSPEVVSEWRQVSLEFVKSLKPKRKYTRKKNGEQGGDSKSGTGVAGS